MDTCPEIKRPAVFLDRDGVLNIDSGYVYRREEFQWVAGATEAVTYLNDLNYLVFVVTNQSGVARGYYSEKDVQSLHQWMNAELKKHNAHIDAFYYCPHHPEASIECYRQTCTCRKPGSGMIRQALSEWPVDIDKSFLIGDRQSDIQAALEGGLRGYLFSQGNLLDFVRGRVCG